MDRKIKTIFAGTPDFAVPFLKSLISNDNFEVVGVLTQPDKPAGRKKIFTSSPVKIFALANGIKIFQPDSLYDNETTDALKSLKPDILVVVAYGLIIPQEILDIFEKGAINVHPSLLPKYRGASPIQTAILHGDKTSGITIILMDEKLDHGPILSQIEVPIAKTDTNISLHRKMADLGVDLLLGTVKDYLDGKIKLQEQDHTKATYCKIIHREDAKINWDASAEDIERQIRAYFPWPVAWTFKGGKRLKIFPPTQIIEDNNHKTGQIFITDNNLTVKCGSNALLIKKLQPEGKSEMTSKDYINGNPNISSTIL